MSCQHAAVRKILFLAAMLGLAASGGASADDSSMSQFTGDSYAYFNHLDYSLGHFNVARGAEAPTRFAARKRLRDDTMVDVDGGVTSVRTTTPHPVPRMLPNPFRDDTGQ